MDMRWSQILKTRQERLYRDFLQRAKEPALTKEVTRLPSEQASIDLLGWAIWSLLLVIGTDPKDIFFLVHKHLGLGDGRLMGSGLTQGLPSPSCGCCHLLV